MPMPRSMGMLILRQFEGAADSDDEEEGPQGEDMSSEDEGLHEGDEILTSDEEEDEEGINPVIRFSARVRSQTQNQVRSHTQDIDEDSIEDLTEEATNADRNQSQGQHDDLEAEDEDITDTGTCTHVSLL